MRRSGSAFLICVVMAIVSAGFILLTSAVMSDSKSKISYQPLGFEDLPDWQLDNHLLAFKTFRRSCSRVIASAAAEEGRVSSARQALVNVCRRAEQLIVEASGAAGSLTGKQAKAFFETSFIPHRVVHDGPRGMLTGYYEPVISGSRTRSAKYQTPIYARPKDLVNLVAEKDRAVVGNKLTHARQTDAGLEPYPTREQIEKGLLKGRDLELLYLADPVTAFFLHIQGSGVIELNDGTSIRVTYDGKNGRPYSSIGQYLIRTGVLGAEEMSLQALGKWLRADPERGRNVMWHNKSFVFFRELKGAEAAGAHGVMDIQLTPGRSLAFDPHYHLMGLPVYVSAPTLRHIHKSKSFNRLMVGQDVGSAIKGPERGDIFFGTGAKAGRLAGVTKEKGQFFVLLPRNNWPATVTAPTASTSPVTHSDVEEPGSRKAIGK